MSEKRLEAQCLCGQASWRINTPPTPFAHCHCSVCRKAHGSAYATYMAAELDALEWLSGEDQVATFESSDGFKRRFCRACGSVVPGIAADGHVFAPPGGVTDDPGAAAKIHIFVASKAPWFTITDELRQFEVFPKGEGPSSITAGTFEVGSPQPHGSCMCGEVCFELTGPITAARFCHCSRCRRGRAATHAANAFAEQGSVRFLKGEEMIRTFKLPEAQFFAQAFCARCGSVAPRVDPSRGIAVIPFGAFDGDPGVAPAAHIFVGSKCPWHEITDDLPQYDAAPM